jgi:hypothetical protein
MPSFKVLCSMCRLQKGSNERYGDFMGFVRRNWEGVAAALFVVVPYLGAILRWIDRIVGWGGSLDFLISRSEHPGWVGSVLTFLLNPPEIVRLVALLAATYLLILRERRRNDARHAALVEERAVAAEPPKAVEVVEAPVGDTLVATATVSDPPP